MTVLVSADLGTARTTGVPPARPQTGILVERGHGVKRHANRGNERRCFEHELGVPVEAPALEAGRSTEIELDDVRQVSIVRVEEPLRLRAPSRLVGWGLWQTRPLPHGPQPAPAIPHTAALWLARATQAVPLQPPFGQETPSQEHAPATQRCPYAHAMPQPPQLSLSLCLSTQSPPHGTRLGGQAHWPSSQTWEAEQGCTPDPCRHRRDWADPHRPRARCRCSSHSGTRSHRRRRSPRRSAVR
jgi:hypothetical protein